MTKGIAKIRGIGFIVWHSRHELYHALLGVAWMFLLREVWHEFEMRWLLLAIFGSVLPDVDHFLYFLSYGKKDWYSTEIRKLLKQGEWRRVTLFIENGHKFNTNLSYHNMYWMGILGVVMIASWFFEWKSGIVFLGAMIIHYVFDIADDVVMLGYLNSNWRRWGRDKKRKHPFT